MMDNESRRALKSIAQAVNRGRLAPTTAGPQPKNPSGFAVHPDAFYGPYEVAYLGGLFAETIEATTEMKEELRRIFRALMPMPKDPYRNVREALSKLPGFLRPPDGSQGLLVQGWILLRFQMLPPLTPGKGWIIAPEEALKLLAERAAPTKTKRRAEPSDAYKRGVEERKAAVLLQKKSSPSNHR